MKSLWTVSSEIPVGSLVRVEPGDFGLEDNFLGFVVGSFVFEGGQQYDSFRCYNVILSETGDEVVAHEIQVKLAY